MRSLLALAAAVSTAVAYPNGAPNARLPTLGWSSWVALGPGAEPPIFDFCDEFSVKASADAFIEVGLYDAGYRHFHLDDCWAGGRNATGYLYAELDHFPNGMKPVIDYVHSKNLSFGLYTCAGTETCVGGRPGSKDHWAQDAAVWAEWGVDWVKMDWCNTNGMVPQEAYANMSVALNSTGRPIAFNMCEWGLDNPWQWGDAVAQSWRMAGDHTATWDSTKSTIAASAAIPAQFTGRPYGWNDMDMLETGCYGQCAHANGKTPNMTATEYMTEFSMWAISASPLQFTSPIMNCSGPAAPAVGCSATVVTQYSHEPCTNGVTFGCAADGVTMWTANGCRADFTCNNFDVIANTTGGANTSFACYDNSQVTCTGWISDLQKQILLNTEVIAINQDVTPQGTPVNGAADLTVWARMLSDGSAAVALYNQEDTIQTISVQFSSLGWTTGTTAAARDLWTHEDLGLFTDRYPSSGGVAVPAHGTHLIRLTKQQ